jgi:hypothetical protein
VHSGMGIEHAKDFVCKRRVLPTNSRPRTVAVHHIAGIRNYVAVCSLWVELRQTLPKNADTRVRGLGQSVLGG